jgi:hypothetical protein
VSLVSLLHEIKRGKMMTGNRIRKIFFIITLNYSKAIVK